jgi:hypothetical protein
MPRAVGGIGLVVVLWALLTNASAWGIPVREVGDTCVANESKPNLTAIPAANMLTSAITESSGVITSWKVQVAPGAGSLEEQLVVLRAGGQGPGPEVIKIAESALETVHEGSNEFPTRIPLSELHNQIGLHGPVATFLCGDAEGSAAHLVNGELPLGESRPIEEKEKTGAPVEAIVEPDRDGDGYGDESQDRCFQSAETHDVCPVVTTEAIATVEPDSILVQVQASSQCTVQVNGMVSWKEPRKDAGPGKSGKETRTAHLGSGGVQPVVPGAVANFTIPLHRALRLRLGQMLPRQALRAMLSVKTTDVVDRETAAGLTVKLRGRKHAKRGAHVRHQR